MKPILLIPMVGLGKRFSECGYQIPKQMIDVNGTTMLELSLNCIELDEFDKIFIVRREHVTNFEIDKFIIDKFGEDVKIIISETDTDGTVSTCLLAEDFLMNNNHLLITTLDVFFEPKLSFNNISDIVDGTIIVFESNNPSYSYSKIDENGLVIKTAEKEVISNLSSVGLYYFKNSSDFVKYSKKMISENIRTNNEFYVCPLYNLLINDGKKINTMMVNRCESLGTPEEINEYLKNNQ
jgi:dTDP-glucose pyrophosphorylase